MRKLELKKNKKGQVVSMILAVITIFIIGIILLFMNRLNSEVYGSLDSYLEDSDYNNTEAHQTLQDIEGVENSNIWDYAFLAIFFGVMIQMLLFSFASRQNVAFFWVFVILAIVVLIIGVALSNIWQEIAANPEFATTIARFPITNNILGTYYPTIVTAITFLGMIILFGKFPGQQQ